MVVTTYLSQLGRDTFQCPIVAAIQSREIIPEIWEFCHCFGGRHRHEAKLGSFSLSENDVYVSEPMSGRESKGTYESQLLSSAD